jgi:indolepyruvate ferredoxin oxidoreductase beta subunit
MAEKISPGDGTADGGKVYEAAIAAARRVVMFDMEAVAQRNGSVMSSVLFGALASSGTLPFPRAAFEATIRAASIGVEASLRAFAAGFDQAVNPVDFAHEQSKKDEKVFPALAPVGDARFDALVADAQRAFPPSTHGMIASGLRKLVDFQDVAYAREYLQIVGQFLQVDEQPSASAHGHLLTRTAAKYVAVAMGYDDVIRVADLKTRSNRFQRIRKEMGAKAEQPVYTTEFMHPRMEEVMGMLPGWLGRWFERHPRLVARLDKVVNRGRRVQTGTLRWFVPLYVIGGLKRFRRVMLRHQREVSLRDAWVEASLRAARQNYDLGVALLECRRLVKGYSDTHSRGMSKFDSVMRVAVKLVDRPDGGEWARRLVKSALADEDGETLAGSLATVESFL